jgi:hypothetical protein
LSRQIGHHLCHSSTLRAQQKIARIVLFGEAQASDRFNVVQEQMAESRQNYAMLKELLKDEDFRQLSGKVLEAQMRLEERRST